MRGITLYLNDLIEERDRERERRRKPKAAAFAVVAAVAGFLAGREAAKPAAAPAPELRVVVRAPALTWPALEEIKPVRVLTGGKSPSPAPAFPVVETADAGVGSPTPVSPELPAGVVDELTAIRGLAGLGEPDALDALPPHLCVSPKAVFFRRGDKHNEARVTISNPATSAVMITGIALRSDRARSGVAVDAAGCERTILSPGEHCTVTVRLLRRIGETTELWIFNDADDPVPLTVMAPEDPKRLFARLRRARAPRPSRPAAGSLPLSSASR